MNRDRTRAAGGDLAGAVDGSGNYPTVTSMA